MAKSKLITVAREGSILRFNIEGVGSFDLDRSELSDDIREAALAHGLIQKISDGAAIPASEAPTAQDKYDAMLAIRDRLTGPDGSWNKRAEGDGSSAPSGLIRRAYVEYMLGEAKKAKKPATEDAINSLFDRKYKDDRKSQLALRNVPAIAAIIERIKAEKGAGKSTVSVDDLAAELDDL